MEIDLATRTCAAGDTLPLLPQGLKSVGHRLLAGAMPAGAGQTLATPQGELLFRVSGFVWLPNNDACCCRAALLTACKNIESADNARARIEKSGHAVAMITLSDKGAAGERQDTAGPGAAALLKDALPVSLLQFYLIPDAAGQLRSLLLNLALEQKFDLICACGGTGLGPRDITPQATLSVLDLEVPGFGEAMRAASFEKTPNAIISRAVCGVIGQCLVLNLPGSKRGAEENLSVVLPALKHALAKLQGDTADCGG